MQHRWSQWAGSAAATAETGFARPRHRTEESHSLTDLSWWKQCVRNNIVEHPRLALGAAVVTGLLVGYWVKRA
jgi:hypothetical protein